MARDGEEAQSEPLRRFVEKAITEQRLPRRPGHEAIDLHVENLPDEVAGGGRQLDIAGEYPALVQAEPDLPAAHRHGGRPVGGDRRRA